jgi:hypothetical protein
MFSLEENGGIRSFRNSESVLLLDKPLSQNHRVRNQLHFFLSTVQRCDWKTLGASCSKEHAAEVCGKLNISDGCIRGRPR